MCLIIQVAKATTTSKFKNGGLLLKPPSLYAITVMVPTNNESDRIKIVLPDPDVIFFLSPQLVCQQMQALNSHKKYIQGQFVKQVRNRKLQGTLHRAS